MKIKKRQHTMNTPYSIDSPLFKKTIKRGLTDLNIPFSGVMIEHMEIHAKELLSWNKTTNLTAIKDAHGVAIKHMVDSAAAFSYIPDDARVLDLGAGGGFPGIPLKILNPSISLTLVDASRKKVSFLNHVIRTLSLDRSQAIHGRGEELGKDPDLEGRFDVVISRAFSSLDIFIPMAYSFLSSGGVMIAMKGKDYAHEEAIFSDMVSRTSAGLDAMTLETVAYSLPLIESSRALLMIHMKNLG